MTDNRGVLLREGERIDDLQRDGFVIIQKPGTFMFGTDSVLLADFAAPRKNERAVDLGCGSGAISLLMLAHNREMTVTGVEIQPETADMARRSALLNSVADRFRVENIDMRVSHETLGYGQFSLAVCNPPYFKNGAAFERAGESERVARGENDLTPEAVAASAARLIKFGGRFAVVYPAARALEMMRAMEDNGIAPKRVRLICGVENKPPKQILIDGIKGGAKGLMWLAPLVLRRADGSPSDEWHRIYG